MTIDSADIRATLEPAAALERLGDAIAGAPRGRHRPPPCPDP